MSPRAVRRVVTAVFVLGIAGMIASSIADNAGAALTAGLVTAVAALCLMVATAVAAPRPPPGEADAARLEEQVERLVAAGAPEDDVRELIRRARALGR
jgi:multisubunit Na+/H+ antiporter MnhB subunit